MHIERQSNGYRPDLPHGEIHTVPFGRGKEVISFISHQGGEQGKSLWLPGLAEPVRVNDVGLQAVVVEDQEWVVKFAEPHGNGRVIFERNPSRDVNKDAVEAAILVKRIIFGDEPVDFAGTSRGGAIALEAAAAYPDDVSTLTISNPAICLPEDTGRSLSLRYGRDVVEQFMERGWDFRRESMKTLAQLLSAPIKSIARGRSLVSLDMATKISKILDAGIDITFLIGEKDPIFPSENTERLVNEVIFDEAEYQEAIRIVKVPGGHYLGSNGKEYSKMVLDAIRVMRKKKVQ